MTNTKNIISIVGLLVLVQLLFQSSIPMARADDSIPTSYSQNLDINGTYVYNVTQFGSSTGWYNFTFGNEGDWKTNPGGQIKINLTGFHNKDSFDWGNVFGDPIPWFDIYILENNLGILNTNFSLLNRSNSEAARALTLGYNNFQPGFLIPTENFTYVAGLAVEQADPGGLFDITGEISIEETNNLIYFGFEQEGGGQNTYMVYDKSTGLLVWAKTSIFGYLLEIQSLNFTLDYNTSLTYNVIQFGGAVGWYNFTFGLEGEWKTNISGQINLNFTGYYDRDPNDWGTVFDDPMPWFDIEIMENNSGILSTNFTLTNRSNSEIAWAFTLGYNNFQPGFQIQIINNLTKVKKLAFQEAEGFVNGIVTIEEKNLAIKISFEQIGGGQRTSLIYEKWTGLLLWAESSIGSYLIEMVLDNYKPWIPQEQDSSPPSSLLEISLPYIIIVSVSVITMASILMISKVNAKIKKFNKYILIAIIATASFTSFFVFSSSIQVSEVNRPQETATDLTLIVDYGNGTIKTQENFVLTNYNTTAFDALTKWCDVEYEDYGELGILVEDVDGIQGNWRFSINGDFPGVSSNKYNLKNGDTVKWVYS